MTLEVYYTEYDHFMSTNLVRTAISPSSLAQEMRSLMRLVEAQEDERARAHFNEELFPRYQDVIATPPYAFAVTFFYDVDDYFNHPARAELGFMSREYLLALYGDEFVPDAAEAGATDVS